MTPRDDRRPPSFRRALRRAAGLTLALAACMTPSVAAAVGLVFVQGGDGRGVDEVQLAFAPAVEGGVAYAQVRATRPSTRFAWVLALDGAPTSVETVGTEFFAGLDQVAGVRFAIEFGGGSSGSGCGGASVSEPPPMTIDPKPTDPVFSGVVAKVDTNEVFGPEDVAALVSRLSEGGWNVAAEVQAALDAQAAKGRSFLLSRQSSEFETVDLAPLKLRFDAHAPVVPLDFFVRSERDRGLLRVNVIDARQVRPTGGEIVTIKDELLRFDGSDARTGTNWPTLLADAVEGAGGDGWVIESAGRTNVLLPLATGYETREFLKAGAYLTRFATSMPDLAAPGAGTFEPAGTDAVDVSPEHTVRDGFQRELVPVLPLLLLLLHRPRSRNSRA